MRVGQILPVKGANLLLFFFNICNLIIFRYNNVGQLFCVLCNTIIKSDLLWDAHIRGVKHKEVFMQLLLLQLLAWSFKMAIFCFSFGASHREGPIQMPNIDTRRIIITLEHLSLFPTIRYVWSSFHRNIGRFFAMYAILYKIMQNNSAT